MDLEARLRQIEDRLEIYNLMAAYGPAVDACSVENNARLWTDDCVYAVGGLGEYLGQDGLAGMIEGPFHRQVTAQGSAHVLSLPYVEVQGDHAVATNYAKLFSHRDGRFDLVRLVVSRWFLRREDGRWKVARRTNELVNGSDESRALQRRATDTAELACVGV